MSQVMRFFFFRLSARFKGVEMLGNFCLPFGKEKCSLQIPVALMESEIQGLLLRAGRGTYLIRPNTSTQASVSQYSHRLGAMGFKSRFWFYLGQV